MPAHWHAPGRLRGRPGERQRELRRQMHPLCAECQKLGIIRPTDEIDHIIPLAMGGSDTDDNVQGLCKPHHDEKTAIEDVSHQAAANHPAWLEPSAIPTTIVCGPPASGKTTYVRNHAVPGDTIIDLDTILASIQPGYTHWSTPEIEGQLLSRAIRARNTMLGQLKRKTDGKAWFIVAAPTQKERDWWAAKLAGTVVLLHPGLDELKRRAIARGTPLSIAGAAKWERKAKQGWAPTKARSVIGLDGWPAN